jgi:hypothetical protein
MGVLSPRASAQIYKDTQYGFKITPPKDWPRETRDSGSSWILAKFISKKTDHYTTKEGWTLRFKPEMTVVAFPHDSRREVKVNEEEDGESEKEIVISLHNPFRDYKDFLKRTYHGGGYYFDKEEETEVKGIPVTCYEAKVEKLTYSGPRRIIAWVYGLEDLDIAVQFEVLEESYAKFRGNILRSLKSFRAIERSGEPIKKSGVEIISRVNWDALPPGERAEQRMKRETEAHEKALADLPKGWRHSKVGRILVLDNYNPGKAKKIAQQCNAIMKWLDKNLDFVGPDEYVRAPILKVFKAEDHYSTTLRMGGFHDSIVIEYEHNPDWFRELNFEQVNRRVMELWFYDRDQALYWAMPRWLKIGLTDLISNARAKGARLEFEKDWWDKSRLKQALDKGQLSTPKELMLMGREKFYSGRWKRDEASCLVRYLLVGPGSKNKKTKDLIWQYMEHLARVTAEIKEEEKILDKDKPTTEEEEEEHFKRNQNKWEKREKRVLDETFKRTFSGWDEKDWKAVTAAYLHTIDH